MPGGAFAGHGGLIASVGAALLGFGLAGLSAAGPHQQSPVTQTAAATTSTAAAGSVGERSAAAARTDTAAARATAARTDAAAARATAAQRATRSGRSTATPAPPRTAAPRPIPKRAADWVNPMPGAEVTSCYGYRWGTLHAGVDLAGPVDTPIRAVADGTVESAGWVQAGYGISVLIDHGNGYLTHYGHMNRQAVRPGESVEAGEVIGYEGSTGDSTGPHLHFEVHQGAWNRIDPAPWMRARGVDIGC
jgi:murein DD-endopeptidase MepM/ murein hydrolase activator NlpD